MRVFPDVERCLLQHSQIRDPDIKLFTSWDECPCRSVFALSLRIARVSTLARIYGVDPGSPPGTTDRLLLLCVKEVRGYRGTAPVKDDRKDAILTSLFKM